jgi:hypothetical protein
VLFCSSLFSPNEYNANANDRHADDVRGYGLSAHGYRLRRSIGSMALLMLMAMIAL